MIHHKRILVALSLLDGGDAPFERALALAKASGAELYLLQAVSPNERFSYRAAERRRRSTELRDRADAAGVNAIAVEQHGDPAEIIVLHADARPVDLIAMGTGRRSGWARLREPSVAERVLRRTKRPTLIVSGADNGRGGAFENVLVAVDLSPASAALVDAAARFSDGAGRPLTLVHAVDGFDAAVTAHNRAGSMVPEYSRYVLEATRQQLARVMPSHVGTGIELHVAAGPAAETIRAHAEDMNADLIVMGRSKRFMHLGSTAVRVLRNAGRALLVVPPEMPAQMFDMESSVHACAA